MEKVSIQKQILLSNHAIFNDVEIDPCILLKDIPQTPALEFISYLLHLYNVRKKDDPRFQSNHLIQWMMKMKGADQKSILNFIEQESDLFNDPHFKLLDRRPCLDLIQHILVYSAPDDKTELNANIYGILFKCLLHFNSVEAQAQEKLFNWDGNGNIREFAEHILIIQVRNIENQRFKDYVLQFLKVYYFFEFCESHEKYSGHLRAFLNSLGLTSYKSYLWKILSPYLELIRSDEPTPKMYIDDEHDTLDFYNRLVINGKITAIHPDYKLLREYPLFETERNMYLFMDFRFFVDKFYNGFLFDFAATTGISYPQLKTDLGNEFSEHILFYKVMEKCFGNYGSIRLTGEAIKAQLNDGEPDYYIRVGSEIFLFEFKDVVITSDIKYCGNADKIKRGIAEKLEKNADGKRKGITQLLNSIKEIGRGHYKQIDPIAPAETIIYPIIVHTDITLESFGVNYFLNERMKELAKEPAFTEYKIKDLVLINLDTLIQLQDHFKDGKLDLEDCINSYITYISVDDPQTAMFPFDEFVKHHFVEKTKLRISNPNDFWAIISSFENS